LPIPSGLDVRRVSATLPGVGLVTATFRAGRRPITIIHLHFLDVPLNLKYQGPNRIRCHATFGQGDELGYFHHGSTIIVVVPAGFELCDTVREGALIRMGEPLMRSF
jgi:Phosphatidylserine decarboxylase